MTLYKIFMIVGVIVVVVGWTAYLLWDWKMRKEEAKQPKLRGEQLVKSRSDVSDWAKKMAEFKSPAPKKPTGGEGGS